MFRQANLNGVVEFQQFGAWFAVIDPAPLIPKQYDLFGLLFGVANFANFRPLFAGRGLPADCENEFRDAFDPREHFGATWATYDELATIDWTIPAETLDERIHEFVVQPDGSERFVFKQIHTPVPPALQTGTEFRLDKRILRRRLLRRSEAKLDTYFDLLLQMMRPLAECFGGDNVRIVVYFH